MRAFEVRPGVVPSWPGVTPAGRVVAEFLARVRVIGDPAAAEELMTATVRCHQLTSEAPTTVLRTPGEYAEHVTEMFATFGRFAYRVTDLLAEGAFGPDVGPPLLDRLGSVCVLPPPGRMAWLRSATDAASRFRGHHGGRTPAEAGTWLGTWRP